jgi:hypothetical protein
LKKFTIIFASILFLIIIYEIIGAYIIYPAFIDDPCYYHVNEASLLIEILFDFPAYEGYHPVPTFWGTIIFGIIGFFVGKRIVKKQNI